MRLVALRCLGQRGASPAQILVALLVVGITATVVAVALSRVL